MPSIFDACSIFRTYHSISSLKAANHSLGIYTEVVTYKECTLNTHLFFIHK